MNTISAPVISVVVPTYNAMPYLREALDSLQKQSYKNLEIICVNDGSTDNSLEVIQEYAEKDTRIKVIDGPNGGYGRAMNKGLRAATGKYFAILEPDDYLPETAYTELVKQAETHNLDFIKGATCSFYDTGDGNRVFTLQAPYPFTDKVFCPRKTPAAFIDISVDSWNGIYNLTFLRENNIEYHESPGASYQDTGFFMQTFSFANRAMFIHEQTYRYRTDNAGSSTNARSSKPYALSGEYVFIRQKLEAKKELWNDLKPLYLARRVGGHRWIYYSLKQSMRLEYLREVRKEFIELEEFDRSLLPAIDQFHLENILISPEHFLTSEAIQKEIRATKRDLTLLIRGAAAKRKVRIYKLLSLITLGKTRQRNRERYKRYKSLSKQLKHIARDI